MRALMRRVAVAWAIVFSLTFFVCNLQCLAYDHPDDAVPAPTSHSHSGTDTHPHDAGFCSMQATLSTGLLLSHDLGASPYLATELPDLPPVLATLMPVENTPTHIPIEMSSQPEQPPRVSL